MWIRARWKRDVKKRNYVCIVSTMLYYYVFCILNVKYKKNSRILLKFSPENYENT